MTLDSLIFRLSAARSDRKRDAQIPIPKGVTACRNLSYGPYGKYNMLDVYYPEGTAQPLPTIVSIHGGGYTYGSKEIYLRYCMELASRGFTVVNFNYRLSPKWRFPAPLEDTNAVMNWICANAERYHMNPQQMFVVGDSAGSQLTSQYAAIVSNPEYAKLFFPVPDIKILAVGLNCGMYDQVKRASAPRKGIDKDYLGNMPASDPRFQVLESIGSNYPPAHITTACNDFLRQEAQPMADFLTSKGIACQVKCYGTPEQQEVAHVFHINIRLPEAKECNGDQIAFFRRYLPVD